MEESTVSLGQLAATSKHFVRRLVHHRRKPASNCCRWKCSGGTRTCRLRTLFLLALGVAAFGMLAGLTLTAAIVVLLWAWSQVAVLLILTALYAAAGICLYRQLIGLLRNWQMLSATLDQLRKDRECLEKILI